MYAAPPSLHLMGTIIAQDFTKKKSPAEDTFPAAAEDIQPATEDDDAPLSPSILTTSTSFSLCLLILHIPDLVFGFFAPWKSDGLNALTET